MDPFIISPNNNREPYLKYTATGDQIEREFEKIEKLGYSVGTSNDSCTICDLMGNLIIDADFQETYELNAIDAINAFFDRNP